MSDDLISRGELIKTLRVRGNPWGNYAETTIRKMPAAYDLNDVIERLQTELGLADNEKERCVRENPLQFDNAKGYAHGISVALEIVKSGGVADE